MVLVPALGRNPYKCYHYDIAQEVRQRMHSVRKHGRTPSENPGCNLSCRQDYIHHQPYKGHFHYLLFPLRSVYYITVHIIVVWFNQSCSKKEKWTLPYFFSFTKNLCAANEWSAECSRIKYLSG